MDDFPNDLIIELTVSAVEPKTAMLFRLSVIHFEPNFSTENQKIAFSQKGAIEIFGSYLISIGFEVFEMGDTVL